MSSEPIVLYVDDEKANRIVFEQSFKDDFRIVVADSAKAAQEILSKETVAVIAVDQRMPEVSGNELLEQVKVLHPEVIRVVITAYSDLDPILRAVNEGLVARYVVKPWDREELMQILRWGVEAFSLGQTNSALHVRLMQTERLVTLGSIGAAVIHDINQPLSYLLSNTERLRQLQESLPVVRNIASRCDDSLSHEERELLRDLVYELPDIVTDMMEGCRVMQGLTHGIRRMLRPTTEKEEQKVDPVPVIRYAISVCRDIAVRARGTLAYDGPSSLPYLRIGSTELSQVLINLVANAAQALERRSTPGGKVLVGVTEQRDTLCISVRDDGAGMSASVLEKIGTPFFSTRKDGTGLGVAQCRRVIEGCGGQIEIHSEEGVGTTIKVTIPQI